MSSPPSNTSAQPAATPAAASSASAAAGITPTEVLTTPESRFYTNLHPVLLLAILIAAFRSLVADPINTLLALAPTLAILQAAYCILCLPSSGNAPAASLKPGQKKKKVPKPPQDLAAKIVVRLLFS
jgi:phosphatidylinositol glycan class F